MILEITESINSSPVVSYSPKKGELCAAEYIGASMLIDQNKDVLKKLKLILI